jgi:glycosyltransferase involved in cell wall biosynthesis
MFNPLVSIITPSYNQAEYLEETILSVINQKYKNIEYILIDGGSDDGSLEIIKKFEKNIAYWVSEKDKGQADAINKGFLKATGEYIQTISYILTLSKKWLTFLTIFLTQNLFMEILNKVKILKVK